MYQSLEAVAFGDTVDAGTVCDKLFTEGIYSVSFFDG
jgi:hypothetical protein